MNRTYNYNRVNVLYGPQISYDEKLNLVHPNQRRSDFGISEYSVLF